MIIMLSLYSRAECEALAGDVRQILTLVHEAERLPWPDKKDLGAPVDLKTCSLTPDNT